MSKILLMKCTQVERSPLSGANGLAKTNKKQNTSSHCDGNMYYKSQVLAIQVKTQNEQSKDYYTLHLDALPWSIPNSMPYVRKSTAR